MADQPCRLFGLDRAVLHIDPYRLATVETHRIDSNRLPRKQPADRQRFKRSLAKPLLHPINGQAMMGREVVEGRE